MKVLPPVHVCTEQLSTPCQGVRNLKIASTINTVSQHDSWQARRDVMVNTHTLGDLDNNSAVIQVAVTPTTPERH